MNELIITYIFLQPSDDKEGSPYPSTALYRLDIEEDVTPEELMEWLAKAPRAVGLERLVGQEI